MHTIRPSFPSDGADIFLQFYKAKLYFPTPFLFSSVSTYGIMFKSGGETVKVLIDADGCPVVDIDVELCRAHTIPCLILCDTSHEIHRGGAETFVFDKGADSVDYALANRTAPGDIVITQDYGLASICLARQARVIHQDGWEYTRDNIDALLLVRHDSRKLRTSGGRMKGPKKRTQNQNDAFRTTFTVLLQTSVQG